MYPLRNAEKINLSIWNRFFFLARRKNVGLAKAKTRLFNEDRENITNLLSDKI